MSQGVEETESAEIVDEIKVDTLISKLTPRSGFCSKAQKKYQ